MLVLSSFILMALFQILHQENDSVHHFQQERVLLFCYSAAGLGDTGTLIQAVCVYAGLILLKNQHY